MSRLSLWMGLVSALAAGCGGGPHPGDPDPDAGPDADAATGPDPDAFCAEIYHQDVFPTFEIEVSDESWAALEAQFIAFAQPPTYVPLISFRYGDQVATEAHIRLKGNPFLTWVPPKMQFVISFNENDPDGRFLGFRKLALDAPPYDPSFLRERLSMSIYRSLGIPAPCVNNTKLMVNGEYYGLYANLERVDREFLERNFGDDAADGNLYEDGTELETNEETGDVSRQQALAQAGDVQGYEALGDLDQWLQEWATEMLLPDQDGFVSGAHNYFLYDHPTRGFLFLPVDKDLAMDGDDWHSLPERSLVPFLFRVPGSVQNAVSTLLLNDGYFAQYVEAMARARTAYEPSVLEARLDEWSAQIADAVVDDPNRPFDVAAHERNLAKLRAYPAARVRWVDGWLTCAQAQPDQARGNCPDCYRARIAERDYVVCLRDRSWSDAVADCEANGATLAVPRDEAEQTALHEYGFGVTNTTWWLGVSDEAKEGAFVDPSGAPLTYTGFSRGQPDGGALQNCVVLNDFGDWDDRSCDDRNPAFCVPR